MRLSFPFNLKFPQNKKRVFLCRGAAVGCSWLQRLQNHPSGRGPSWEALSGARFGIAEIPLKSECWDDGECECRGGFTSSSGALQHLSGSQWARYRLAGRRVDMASQTGAGQSQEATLARIALVLIRPQQDTRSHTLCTTFFVGLKKQQVALRG